MIAGELMVSLRSFGVRYRIAIGKCKKERGDAHYCVVEIAYQKNITILSKSPMEGRAYDVIEDDNDEYLF